MNTRSIVVIVFGATVATAGADTRSSANYTITTDTIDGGGTRKTSASYSNNGSIGGIAGISSVAAPAGTL